MHIILQTWIVKSEMFNTYQYFFVAKYVNALRWWNNISSYKSEFAKLPAGAAAAAAAEEDEDDVDLFASDDEEEDAEAERIKVI